jgi:hypothetical protein
VAYKDRSSYFDLGDKCRLMVLDLKSGTEIARAARWASGRGVCWLADSETVLFPSFDDERLYGTTQDQVSGDVSYGTGYAKDGQFQSSLFALKLATGEITPFAKGHSPSLAGQLGQVLVRDGNVLRLVDSQGRETKRFEVQRLDARRFVVSPDGLLVVGEMRRRTPFYPGGSPILIDAISPSMRHALGVDYSYRFDWAE